MSTGEQAAGATTHQPGQHCLKKEKIGVAESKPQIVTFFFAEYYESKRKYVDDDYDEFIILTCHQCSSIVIITPVDPVLNPCQPQQSMAVISRVTTLLLLQTFSVPKYEDLSLLGSSTLQLVGFHPFQAEAGSLRCCRRMIFQATLRSNWSLDEIQLSAREGNSSRAEVHTEDHALATCAVQRMGVIRGSTECGTYMNCGVSNTFPT